MSKYKVVVTDDRYRNYDVEKAVLETIGAEVTVHDCSTAEEVLNVCRYVDGIMVNLAPIPENVIQGLQKCRVIARYGVGYDNVDVKTCTQKGIYVTNVTDYCAEEVSDHALALLLGCIRKIARRDAQVRKGKWNVGSADPIQRIAGKTFALLGYGLIARCLHRKLKGLNPGRVLVYDPFLEAGFLQSQGAEKVDFEIALKEADYISIHMPLNDKTRGLIDEKAFSLMKPTAILVNTSRGAIVDEAALIKALSTGQINSAGLDVYSKEPLDRDNPLLTLGNCILTDHMGWYSEESMVELKRKVAENVRNVLSGGKPAYPVNIL
jgi:D-3-phosphoglycerate dehydrogenase